VALADFRPSPDGKLIVYAIAEGGADWRTLRVRDVATGRDLSDEVKWVRFSWLSWTRDGKGFFYSRFPEPPAGQMLHAALGRHALYYHRLGTPQSEDVLVYERPDLTRAIISATVPREGRYLFIRVGDGAGPINRLYYAELGDPQQPDVRAAVKPLAEQDGSEYTLVANIGTVAYVRTDDDAPNGRIVSIDLREPRREAWKTVVPEAREAMRIAAFSTGRLLIEYLSDAQSRLVMFGLDGKPRGEIALPDAGELSEVGGQRSGRIFYRFSSPLHQPTVFRYNLENGETRTFDAPSAPIDARRYETRRHFAVSKDGTRVPYFVTARKDLKLDGANPTLLYGYGGYSLSVLPAYRPHALAWLELGGVWVSASIRGGGEYGREWHRAVRVENSQKRFDDFIAVSEQLVKDKVTSPARLGIVGKSNGGLLVSVVSQQRPDLYAVVLPDVSVTDMLRFDRFTGGRAWIPEYGSPGNAQHFQHLLRYSPLHNVKTGTCYPATLVTTADHDDRVVPLHSFKFTAALQASQGCARPVLLRVEPKASHGYRRAGGGIDELVDMWAFAAEHTGMRPH
jgi:prolyl oligopeptidase